MSKIPSYYWDSCIFIAYFNNERQQHGYLIDHIEQFLNEAKTGQCQIYTSSITIAEITEPTLIRGGHRTFNDFLRDFQSSIFMINADPNTMSAAATLRSQQYTDGNGSSRSLSTPDAIHLATAISLINSYNVSLERLHTFDAGGSRGLDKGRGIPMLNFEQWTLKCSEHELVKQVIRLKRAKPEHPTPQLDLRRPQTSAAHPD